MQHYFTRFAMVCMGCLYVLMSSCLADVDLDNIDTDTSVHLSMGIPLGETSIRVGDLLGDSTLSGLRVDSVNGRYVYSDTMSSSYDFYAIDLVDYVQPHEVALCLDSILVSLLPSLPEVPEIPDLPFLPDIPSILDSLDVEVSLPANTTVDINIPIELDLSGLNADRGNQRLDSIEVNLAKFLATISLKNIDFAWSDIQTLELSLGKGFRCFGSNVISIPVDAGDFNQKLPIDLKNFNIVLLEDPQLGPIPSNMLNSLEFNLHLVLKTSQEIPLKTNQEIRLGLGMQDIDFAAIYGYINTTSYLHQVVDKMPLDELWGSWSALDGLIIPIREPSIKLYFEHALSMPLLVKINKFGVSSGNETKYATFNGQPSTKIHIPAQIPLDAPLNARATDSIILDYTPEHGNLAELFTIHPENISYDFSIEGDTSIQKQFRITNDLRMNMKWGIDMPFEFNEGIHISYNTTIDSIDLTALQLDSLIAEIQAIKQVDEVDLHLFLTIENWIPFDIFGHITLYNEANEVVQLSGMEKETLDLHLLYPKDHVVDGVVVEPSKNIISLELHKDDFARLASVNHIELSVDLGDNVDVVKLAPDESLHISAGITADIDAVINLFEAL